MKNLKDFFPKEFLMAQERAIRPSVKLIVDKLSHQQLIEFNKLIMITLKEKSNVSEFVGELRLPFISIYNLYFNETDYKLEKACLIVINQLVQNSELLEITKDIKKYQGEFKVIYRVKPIGFTANSRTKEVKGLRENFKSFDTLKLKGHALLNRKVAPEVMKAQEASETNFKAKYFDKSLFELHAFLVFYKNKDKIKYSKIQYKKYLWSEAQYASNICNAEFKLTKFFDTRGRGYVNSVFGAFNPLGDHFQSRLVEYTEEYIVTENDIEYAKWLIWTDLKGRMPMSQALEEYNSFEILREVNNNIAKIAHSRAEMLRYKTLKRGETLNDVLTPNELGDMLYFNELASLIINGVGQKSSLLLEVDMTNSGLIHFANSVRTKKTLTLANLKDKTKVWDSHTNLVQAFIKTISNIIKG